MFGIRDIKEISATLFPHPDQIPEFAAMAEQLKDTLAEGIWCPITNHRPEIKIHTCLSPLTSLGIRETEIYQHELELCCSMGWAQVLINKYLRIDSHTMVAVFDNVCTTKDICDKRDGCTSRTRKPTWKKQIAWVLIEFTLIEK